MKLVVIPPYQNPEADTDYTFELLMDKFKKEGHFEGDVIDLDKGFPLESTSPARDAAFVANITKGFLQKIKAYSEMGKYDAIVSTGFADPGFEPARTISKIPVAGAVHSSLHMASLIGKRTSIVIGTMPLAMAVRQIAESYGLGHKLASLRAYGHSTTELIGLLSKYKERLFDTAEAQKISEDMVSQCITAIDRDRVDSIILGCEPTELWEREIRERLDAAGYDEIPLICPTAACFQMAKVMVHMKLTQAPRAYPTDTLRAQPEYA